MSKPNNWSDLSEEEKRKIGVEFFGTPRAQLIIGKALYHMARQLKEKEYPEISDAEDMELLGESVFYIGYGVEVFMEEYRNSSNVNMTG